jgi:hypothetical protein
MSQDPTAAPQDKTLLGLIAHLDDENEHEAMNALLAIRRRLAKNGQRIADLPSLFATKIVTRNPESRAAEKHAASVDRARRAAEKRAKRNGAAERSPGTFNAEAERRRTFTKARNRIIKALGGSLSDAVEAKGLEKATVIAWTAGLKEWAQYAKRNKITGAAVPQLKERFLGQVVKKPGIYPRSAEEAEHELTYWATRQAELVVLYWGERPGELLHAACQLRRDLIADEFNMPVPVISL